MTEGVNRQDESPQRKKGLFSRAGKEKPAAAVQRQHGDERSHSEPEQPASTEGSLAVNTSAQAADESRFDRLRRVFSRKSGNQSAAEAVADSGSAARERPAVAEFGEEAGEPADAAPFAPVEDRETESQGAITPPAPREAAPVDTTEPDIQAEAAAAGGVVDPPGDGGAIAREGAVAGQSQPVPEPQTSPGKESGQQRFGRIRKALSKTGQGLGRVFLGKKQIDDELLEELETRLLTADLGFEVTSEIIEALAERVRRKELNDVDALQTALRDLLVEILKPCEVPLDTERGSPFVMMTVGVNGVGKTTTIGKLAKLYLGQGKSVMLAAGDTFRAAAVEQLQVWGERNQVPVVAQHTGADSASVIFDAVASARARNTDLLIADTAGRLHTKSNLMDELKKIKRVLGKLDESAPHEILLVLDAGTGQNAVTQLQQFHDAVGITGIVLTKLDGTAKGGVIFALCRRFGIPVRYIGVGETVDDLQPFRAEDFVAALLAQDGASDSAREYSE